MYRTYLCVSLWFLLCIVVCTEVVRGCDEGQFHCGTGDCIPISWTCDRVNDCADDSDEIDCPFPSCAATQFSCVTDHTCISQSFVCDGEDDCDDASDEHQRCPGRTCSIHEFTCASGHCIPELFRCDHSDDCPDSSDEHGCDYDTCAQLACASGACVNTSLWCDGTSDCRDGSDETNCTERCKLHEMQCPNGECIPQAYVCDHIDDCGDGSDEQHCEYGTCPGNRFTCSSGYCIRPDWVCDGDNDCGDESDEIGCESNDRMCYPGEWLCPGSKVCIPIGKVCDNTPDCPNATDEQNSSNNHTCGMESCSILSCEYQCHASPSGGSCHCPLGYILSDNNVSCVDFDDCKMWGVCDQLCEDRPGNHICRCADGYILEHGRHCRADTSVEAPFLIFSSGKDLMKTDMQGQDTHTLVSSEGHGVAVGVDFHYEKKRIYWTDTVQNKVFVLQLETMDVQTVLSDALEMPENIAVDWISDKLYIVESAVNRIDLCDLDGKNRLTLIAQYLGNPRGIALDPTIGFMFFTDWSDKWGNPQLERAFMDGSNRVLLVRSKLGWPAAISLDLVLRRLYWVDNRYDYIETVTYDGLDRKTILSGGVNIPHPFGVTLFENHVFFTDWTLLALTRVNRFNGSDPNVLHRSSLLPYGVAAYHSVRQPQSRPIMSC